MYFEIWTHSKVLKIQPLRYSELDCLGMLSEVDQLYLVSLWNTECKTSEMKKDALKLYSVTFDKRGKKSFAQCKECPSTSLHVSAFKVY